eukprot:747175-Hanusia_phi.AAC.2
MLPGAKAPKKTEEERKGEEGASSLQHETAQRPKLAGRRRPTSRMPAASSEAAEASGKQGTKGGESPAPAATAKDQRREKEETREEARKEDERDEDEDEDEDIFSSKPASVKSIF